MKVTVDTKHSITSASSAERWLNCPGSAVLSLLVESEPQSKEASEGTIAHEWAAKHLEGEDISSCEDKTMFHTALYLRSIIKTLEKKVGGFNYTVVEKHIIFNKYLYGTADFAATYADNTKALIVDLKYGQGVPVHAAYTPQLVIYALCLEKTLGIEFESVTVMIYLPRSYRTDMRITSRQYLREELQEYKEKILAGITKVQDIFEGKQEAEFSPGHWCQFCKAAPICSAPIDKTEETGLIKMKKEIEIPDIEKLSHEQLASIMLYEEQIVNFFKKTRTYMEHLAINRGVKFHGWKLTPKQTRTRFKSEDVVVPGLKKLKLKEDEIFVTKKTLAPFGPIAKKYGRETIEHLLEKPEGAPKLVPDSTPGQEVFVNDNLAGLLGNYDDE